MPQPPNIILILADDMGYGDLGCYGSEMIRTPHIDALAARGVRFTDFHSNGAVCSPTRAALMTGRYQQRCGIEGVISAANHRHMGMPLREITFAQVLKRMGYATAIFGKWHLGYDPNFSPIHRGFDAFRGFVAGNVDYFSHIDQVGIEDWWDADQLQPEEGYTTDLVTEHGVRFIRAHRQEPICLYLAHECPHYPYQGPDDRAYRMPGNPQPIQGPRMDRGVAYREMIEALDAGVGRIIAEVEASGLAENTFIFFLSDNGPAAVGSSGGLHGGKGSVWEGGHRVPAIACWPGHIEGRRTSQETGIGMDLFPTFAALAGVEQPPDLHLDGVDLMPHLLEDERLPARPLFWRAGGRKAARYGPWKLVVGERDAPEPALYHLGCDLAEKENLAAEEPARLAQLLDLLATWEADVGTGAEGF